MDKQAKRELDGEWACEAATINGRALDEATVKSLKLTLKGEQYKTQRNEEVLFESSYAVDTSTDPKRIDMVGIGELQGKIGEGIYKLEKDRLTLCYSMPGHDRPTEFASKEGSQAQLLVWRRMKADR